MGLLALGSDNLRRLTLLLKYADRLPALIEALASGAGERSSVYTRWNAKPCAGFRRW